MTQQKQQDGHLYLLEPEQVAFLTQLLENGLQLSGKPSQVRETLALVDGIEAALSSPVAGKETTHV